MSLTDLDLVAGLKEVGGVEIFLWPVTWSKRKHILCGDTYLLVIENMHLNYLADLSGSRMQRF